MNTHIDEALGIDESLNDAWESGLMGRDSTHASRASVELEAEVDRALAMKLVTIRLPEPMIDALKSIASFHGIGYQPMVRDLLTRFIDSEVPAILSQMHSDASTKVGAQTTPVDNFMERKRCT